MECTSAAIQGLKLFNKTHPEYRASDIETCIEKALNFIQSIQLSDGSWYGSWGVCYTYGTWFGITGLIAGGKTYENSPSVKKACEFLLSKQLTSGGWGESYLSSQNMVNPLDQFFFLLFFPLFFSYYILVSFNLGQLCSFLCNIMLQQVYTNIGKNKSHIVQTGWALLALIEAGQVSFHTLHPSHRIVGPHICSKNAYNV